MNTGVGSLSLLQGIFPDLGIEPGSSALQADSLPAEPQGSPVCAQPAANGGTAVFSHTDLSWDRPALHWGLSKPQWAHQENWNLSGLLWG